MAKKKNKKVSAIDANQNSRSSLSPSLRRPTLPLMMFVWAV